MALPETPQRMTEDEYLAFERASEIKHEYFNGEVFTMAGASFNHTRLVGRLTTSLNIQLASRECDAHPIDLKVHVPATGSFVYPDVVVMCSDPQFRDDKRDVVTNPLLIIEVLSPSTEALDRGLKFTHYRALPSLQEYVLVSQDRPQIESFTRQESGLWVLADAQGMDAILDLPSVDGQLRLADIYARINFDDAS